MNAFFIVPTNWRAQVGELFMDHPPLEKRLAALAEISREMGKRACSASVRSARRTEPNHFVRSGSTGSSFSSCAFSCELARVVALLLLAGRDERPERAGLEAVDPVDRACRRPRSGTGRRGAGAEAALRELVRDARRPPSPGPRGRGRGRRPTRSRTCPSSARASSPSRRRRPRAALRRPCRPARTRRPKRLEDDGADAGRLEPALDVERHGGGREREEPVARRAPSASCARRGCRRDPRYGFAGSCPVRRSPCDSCRRRARPPPSASRARPRPGSSRRSARARGRAACGCRVTSSSAPRAVSSSIADARACSSSVLSRARWIAMPVSCMPRPMPVAASPILTCAWRPSTAP